MQALKTFVAIVILLAPSLGFSEIIMVAPNGDLPGALRNLTPGDEVILAGGIYNLASRFEISAQGTADAPIIIRAAEGETPVITRPDERQNTINIQDSRYVHLVGIEVRGGSHGIRLGNSSFVTIRNCHIHHTDQVAVSANFVGDRYEGLHMVGNHIHHTGGHGEAFYFGCNEAGCAVFNSILEDNYIHDLTEGVLQGDGIELKRGCFDNIVRNNVIHDTNYPCIIVYGSAEGGPNILEGNVMWGCGDHAIQAAADTRIINNIILGAAQDGIYGREHQGGIPGNLYIAHNTIINNQNTIRLEGIQGPVTIVNNALYSADQNAIRVSGDPSQLTVAGNVGQGGLEGINEGFTGEGNDMNDFIDLANRNVFPTANSALVGAADAMYVLDTDFNGTARNGRLDVGAYVFDADGNPGWVIAPEFKPSTSAIEPGNDGGVPPDAGIPDLGSADGGRPAESDMGGGATDVSSPRGDAANGQPLCEPGATQACACTTGANGAQACRDDRQGWQTCACQGTGSDGGVASRQSSGGGGSGGCRLSNEQGSLPIGCLLFLVFMAVRRRNSQDRSLT